jgi:phospholipid-binding lipoprotein MlaA
MMKRPAAQILVFSLWCLLCTFVYAQVEDELLDNGDLGEVFEEELVVSDPLEAFNRAMFAFNDVLYMYGLRPLKTVYRVVPEPMRESIARFFSNLSTPIRFANSVLQIKLGDAGREAGRFVINSTLGIGGLFDPAQSVFEISKKEEDFGQTLGRWGLGGGPYLVLPVVGPTNLRDAGGRLVDTWFEPAWYLLGQETGYYLIEETSVGFNELSLDPDTYETIRVEQLDPYLFIRDAYVQRRAAKVAE